MIFPIFLPPLKDETFSGLLIGSFLFSKLRIWQPIQYSHLRVIVLQNVELQNAELQNAEFQNIELQNAELQNAELKNVESYRTSNLTKRRNIKRRILQKVEIQNVDNTKRRKNDRIGWLMYWEIIYFSLHCD